MVMKIAFRIQKYCQICDGISAGYTSVTEFVIVVNCIHFPRKRNDSSFVNIIKFHVVGSTPTAYELSINVVVYKARAELTVRKF
jgi:hypothetical protein